MSADIVCLEEVDHFTDFFQPKMENLGYLGKFFPKRDSPCLRMPENSGPDGCAIFHKQATLSLAEERAFALQADGKECSQVAILQKFCLRGSDATDGATVCVAATHLKAKPEHAALRRTQGQYLLEEINKFAADVPVIVCGDFNAEPDEPVSELFAKQLKSAFSNVPGSFTTWKFRPSGEADHTIDYIWHSPACRLEKAVPLPSKTEIGEDALPSLKWPSDHLPLVADFKIEQWRWSSKILVI